MINLCPSLKSLADQNWFLSRVSTPFSASSVLQFGPVLADEKHPHHIILLPPCFTVGMAFLGQKEVRLVPDITFPLVARKIDFSLLWPEFFLPCVWRGSPIFVLGNSKRVHLFFFWKQWIFSCQSSIKAFTLWSVRLKVVLWTDASIFTIELCCCLRVIFSLFVASLINALLTWSTSLGRWLSFGSYVVVLYLFHI